MDNNKNETKNGAAEDAFERSGRIFLGEAGLTESTKQLEERLAHRGKYQSFRSIAKFLLPLVAVVALLFFYMMWPATVKMEAKQHLQQAIQEPLSLVALGESMTSGEVGIMDKDRLHAFKNAYRQMQYEEALDHILLLTKNSPKSYGAIPFDLYKADLYLKLGRYTQALELLQDFATSDEVRMKADISYCITYYTGLAYLALGDQQEARAYLERSAQQGGRLGEEAKILLNYLE